LSSSSSKRSKRTAVLLRLEAFERTVRVLESVAAQLDTAQSERGVRTVPAAAAAAAEAHGRLAHESHMRDLVAARQMRDTEVAKLARIDEGDRVVRDRLRSLRDEICPACRTRTKCDAFVRCCARTLCTACARTQLDRGVCALCDGCVDDAVVSVPCLRGMGTKMTRIGELICSLNNDPVVLFVQWKSMVRGTRSFLASLGARVLLMEGSMAQRASTLAEFATSGVLLLCLEDCFAGLHLPHVRHIVFAHAIVAERKQVERYERQAIARCVRYGQTEQVNVYSFVVSDTEEERLWNRTHSESEGTAAVMPTSAATSSSAPHIPTPPPPPPSGEGEGVIAVPRSTRQEGRKRTRRAVAM